MATRLRTGLALATLILAVCCPRPTIAQVIRVHSDEDIAKTVVQFESRVDRFNGAEIRSLKKPFMPKVTAGAGAYYVIADLKLLSAGSDTLIALQLLYSAKSWAFLRGTATALLDDGTRLTLGSEEDDLSKPTRDVSRLGIQEVVNFRLTCAQLARLAACRGIDVRLDGDKSSVDVSFPREGIAALRTLRIEAGCQPFSRD